MWNMYYISDNQYPTRFFTMNIDSNSNFEHILKFKSKTLKSICIPVCLKHVFGVTINMNIFTTLKTGNKSIETNFMHMRVINGLTTVNAPQRTLTSMRCAENDPILKTA